MDAHQCFEEISDEALLAMPIPDASQSSDPGTMAEEIGEEDISRPSTQRPRRIIDSDSEDDDKQSEAEAGGGEAAGEVCDSDADTDVDMDGVSASLEAALKSIGLSFASLSDEARKTILNKYERAEVPSPILLIAC